MTIISFHWEHIIYYCPYWMHLNNKASPPACACIYHIVHNRGIPSGLPLCICWPPGQNQSTVSAELVSQVRSLSKYEVSIRTGGVRDSHRSNSKEFLFTQGPFSPTRANNPQANMWQFARVLRTRNSCPWLLLITSNATKTQWSHTR